MNSFKKFFSAWVDLYYVPAVINIASCLGACGAIISDWGADYGTAFILLSILTVAVQPITIVAALLQHRWGKAAVSLLTLVISVAFTFFTIIGIAVGQHHPPIYEEVDSTEVVIDTVIVVEDSIE